MPSKKPINSKRTNLPRASDFTKDFLNDWQRLVKTGRYDMVRLKEVMLLLIANNEPLGAEWKDHELKGNWAGFRELHVGGDFLSSVTVKPPTSGGGYKATPQSCLHTDGI